MPCDAPAGSFNHCVRVEARNRVDAQTTLVNALTFAEGVGQAYDHVLVLGDHRGRSVDGRWFGFVPVDALYARALAVYWRSGDGLGWRRL